MWVDCCMRVYRVSWGRNVVSARRDRLADGGLESGDSLRWWGSRDSVRRCCVHECRSSRTQQILTKIRGSLRYDDFAVPGSLARA